MFSSSIFHTICSVLLSAAMALPAPLWAASSQISDSAELTIDNVPVLLQPITTQEGKIGYLALAPVSMEDEPTVVANLAKNSPKQLVLAVSSAKDPALKSAIESGNLESIDTYIFDSANAAPLLNSDQLSSSLKQKFLSKTKKVTDFVKKNGHGLLMSLYVSGLSGAHVMYQSGSIEAGLVVFTAVFMWTVFQAVFPEAWTNSLEKSGVGLMKFISGVAGLFGKSLSPRAKHLLVAGGSFALSWAANTSIVSLVFASAGEFEGIVAAALYGFGSSYDIMDKNIANQVDRGQMHAKWLSRWILLRIFLGSLIEVAGFIGVPFVLPSLVLLTAVGVGWLMLGPDNEERVRVRFGMMKTLLKEVHWPLFKNRINGSFQSIIKSCEESLMSTKTPVFAGAGYPPDDIQ